MRDKVIFIGICVGVVTLFLAVCWLLADLPIMQQSVVQQSTFVPYDDDDDEIDIDIYMGPKSSHKMKKYVKKDSYKASSSYKSRPTARSSRSSKK